MNLHGDGESIKSVALSANLNSEESIAVVAIVIYRNMPMSSRVITNGMRIDRAGVARREAGTLVIVTDDNVAGSGAIRQSNADLYHLLENLTLTVGNLQANLYTNAADNDVERE